MDGRIERENHTIWVERSVVRARVWRRPDLDFDTGARLARSLAETLVDLLSEGRGFEGLVLDLSEAPAVAGDRTLGELTRIVRQGAAGNRRVAVVTGGSAAQALQLKRLCREASGEGGRVVESPEQGMAWVATGSDGSTP